MKCHFEHTFTHLSLCTGKVRRQTLICFLVESYMRWCSHIRQLSYQLLAVTSYLTEYKHLKQGKTTSLALSQKNKIHLPAPLMLTNLHFLSWCKNILQMVMYKTISWPWQVTLWSFHCLPDNCSEQGNKPAWMSNVHSLRPRLWAKQRANQCNFVT